MSAIFLPGRWRRPPLRPLPLAEQYAHNLRIGLQLFGGATHNPVAGTSWTRGGTPTPLAGGMYFGSGNYFETTSYTTTSSGGAGNQPQHNFLLLISFLPMYNSEAAGILNCGTSATPTASSGNKFLLQNNSGTIRALAGGSYTNYGPAVLGKIHTLAFAYSDINPYPSRVCLNGQIVLKDDTYREYIWNYVSLGSGYPVAFRGAVFDMHLWQRPPNHDHWTQDELCELTLNPWSVYETPKRRIYVPSAGGGSQSLTPSLFTNTNTFHAPTVTAGAVTLAPALFTNTQTFYSPTVSAAYSLTPALYTNTQVFFGPTVSATYALTPSLFTNAQSFFSPTVSTSYTLTPALFTNTQTFYSPIVSLEGGAQNLLPNLYTNIQTFYSPTITAGAVTLQPSLYTNAQSFSSPTVSATYTIAPSLFTNGQTFYSPTIVGGTLTISPDLFVNEQVFFGPAITGGLQPGGLERGGGAGWPVDDEYYHPKRERSSIERIKDILDEVDEEMREAVSGEPLAEVLKRPVDAAAIAGRMTPKRTPTSAARDLDEDDDFLLLSF